jgi:SpoVK/Ycf46/Vps4 family AAA+-type ATPase
LFDRSEAAGFGRFSIVGDKPIAKGMHWQRLHDAVIEARARVSKAYTQMDEIDGNAKLSREEKQAQRSEVAAHALAEFEASKALVRSREAVKHDGSPAALKALEQAEAGWNRAMDKIAERASTTKGSVIGTRAQKFSSPWASRASRA